MAQKQSGKGSKKIGRNKTKCSKYRLEQRRERNKARKQNKLKKENKRKLLKQSRQVI